jgi:hypothetical protein
MHHGRRLERFSLVWRGITIVSPEISLKKVLQGEQNQGRRLYF